MIEAFRNIGNIFKRKETTSQTIDFPNGYNITLSPDGESIFIGYDPTKDIERQRRVENEEHMRYAMIHTPGVIRGSTTKEVPGGSLTYDYDHRQGDMSPTVTFTPKPTDEQRNVAENNPQA